jgi:hypothetical protein
MPEVAGELSHIHFFRLDSASEDRGRVGHPQLLALFVQLEDDIVELQR